MAKAERDKLFSMYIPHARVEYDPGGPSMTRQEFAEESDINAIMSRYEKVGVWPLGPNDGREPAYLDLSEMPSDLMSTLEMMRAADAAFMSLPAVARREFDNDAVKFVEFASDPTNVDRLRDWGLAPPVEAPAPPMKVEVVNSDPPADK